jgi:3-deoxy-manno-octulosonate cytidylyltransferase (CMP-KDO synthetase)
LKAELISSVLVATDDERIKACAEECGAEGIMTSPDLPSGTDRVAAAVRELNVDIIINVQGDEPFITPQEIDSLAAEMTADTHIQMATLIRKTPLTDGFTDSNTVKVVIDSDHYALYFTRSPVPFQRDRDQSGPEHYLQHIGIYAYTKKFLLQYTGWKPSFLEECEKLEQLRVLENGCRIKTVLTEHRHLCVDTPEDLEQARSWAESTGRRP